MNSYDGQTNKAKVAWSVFRELLGVGESRDFGNQTPSNSRKS